ncbi:MAG: CPBP family intramembrane metalloprotease [Thermoleophilia bacterium]|nr:CPBP family intramembrane metalloprotease [Thermoleophilia bacterium]
MLLFVALQYQARRTGPGPSEDFLYRWEVFAGGLAQGVLTLGVVLALAWNGPVGELLGWRPPVGWGSAVGLGFALFVGVALFAAAVDPILGASEEQGFVPEAWDRERAAPFAANFVLAAGVFPVVEELLFRGVGYSLLTRFGASAAIVVTAVLFGLAHGLVNALPILVVFGLGLGWLRRRTESVLPCVLAHAAFNAAALVGVVIVGERG